MARIHCPSCNLLFYGKPGTYFTACNTDVPESSTTDASASEAICMAINNANGATQDLRHGPDTAFAAAVHQEKVRLEAIITELTTQIESSTQVRTHYQQQYTALQSYEIAISKLRSTLVTPRGNAGETAQVMAEEKDEATQDHDP